MKILLFFYLQHFLDNFLIASFSSLVANSDIFPGSPELMWNPENCAILIWDKIWFGTGFGNWKLFKKDEKWFLFHLKKFFRYQDI